MTESTKLLDRRGSVHFKNINSNQDANLEQAASNYYESIVDNAVDSEMDEDAIWLREQRDLNELLHWFKRPSLFMIGFTMFMLSFTYAAGDSTRRFIYFKLGCNSIIRDSKNPYCDPSQTEILISNLQLFETVLSGISSLVTITKIGTLSDQYGRKLFVFVIVFTYLLGKVFKYYLVANFTYLRFWLLVFLDLLFSLSGGMIAFVSLVNCYVSDIADIHQRGYYIGVCLAFFYGGISVGPIVGNLLLELGKRFPKTVHSSMSGSAYAIVEPYEYYPLKFELVVMTFLSLFIAFVLPESRSHKARRKSQTQSMNNLDNTILAVEPHVSILRQLKQFSTNVFASIINYFKPATILLIPLEFKPNNITHDQFRRERIALLMLVFIDCIGVGLATHMGPIYVLYGILKYNWNATAIGYFTAISCGSKAIVLVILSPIVNHHIYHILFKFKVMKRQFDMIDFANTIVGLLSEGLASIGFVFSNNTGTFLFWVCVSSLLSFVSPNLNSAILKYFPDSKTGQVFAAVSLVKSLFGLATPIVLLTIYKYALTIEFPELIFIFFAVITSLLIGAIIVVKTVLVLNVDSVPQVLTRTDSFSILNHSRNNSTGSRDLHRKKSDIGFKNIP